MTTPQDFDRLSAYLDGQLPPREKARLEARLAKEAELKAAWDDLRAVKRALRILPIRKVPHNFTLTPAQAGQRAPSRYPALQLAAALASLAFIVVFGGDLALGLSARTGVAAPAPEVAVAQRSAAPSETPAPAADESLASATSAEPTASGPTSLMAGAASETPTAAAALKSATPLAPPDGQGGGGAGDAGGGAPVAPGPTLTPALETITLVTETPAAESQAVVPPTPAPGLAPIRYVEITLGLLAVILVAAVFLLRR